MVFPRLSSLFAPSSPPTITRNPRSCRHKSSYDHYSAQLGYSSDPTSGKTAALAASITPHDTVILTSDGHRLPGIPLPEARRLNMSRLRLEEFHKTRGISPGESDTATFIPLLTRGRPRPSPVNIPTAPAYSHPLFPPLPLYGPATLLRQAQCYVYRVLAGLLSTCFLLAIMVGAIVKGVPCACHKYYLLWWKKADPDKSRPFYQIELDRAKRRKQDEEDWKNEVQMKRNAAKGKGVAGMRNRKKSFIGRTEIVDVEKAPNDSLGEGIAQGTSQTPTTAGEGPSALETPLADPRDKLVCDVGYYARRVGLDIEEYKIETEDGFLITLQRVFDPKDPPLDANDVEDGYGHPVKGNTKGRRKYPVLLMHGLLQSSGAFCVNDDDSLAFLLCKRWALPVLRAKICGTYTDTKAK